jgi:hypothetical protein
MQNKCSICGKHRYHGGDKKLAAAHSKIAQKKHEAERKRLEELNGKTEKKQRVILPFSLIQRKNGSLKRTEFY